MKQAIKTGLPEFGRPVEWATKGGGLLLTTAVPIKADGTFETGEVRSQIALALDNLETAVKAGGGTLADVLQVMVHLTDPAHIVTLNDEWATRFVSPYPSRAIVIVKAIGVPGIVIMMQVFAYIDG